MKIQIQKLSLSVNKLSLSCIVATEEVTDDTIIMRHIMRLIRNMLERSRPFKEVVNAIDVLRQIACSQKQQDSIPTL